MCFFSQAQSKKAHPKNLVALLENTGIALGDEEKILDKAQSFVKTMMKIGLKAWEADDIGCRVISEMIQHMYPVEMVSTRIIEPDVPIAVPMLPAPTYRRTVNQTITPDKVKKFKIPVSGFEAEPDKVPIAPARPATTARSEFQIKEKSMKTPDVVFGP